MSRNEVEQTRLSPRVRRDLDVQIGFLQGVVRRDQSFTEALQLLGDSYSKRGRYEDSLKVDQHLIRREPRNPNAYCNLACSHARNGCNDRAVAALERAPSRWVIAISNGCSAIPTFARCAKTLALDASSKRLRRFE